MRAVAVPPPGPIASALNEQVVAVVGIGHCVDTVRKPVRYQVSARAISGQIQRALMGYDFSAMPPENRPIGQDPGRV
jgi:hypothetical protein